MNIELCDNEEFAKEVIERNHKCNNSFQMIFFKTGIGCKVVMMCNKCGAEFDITDYEIW